MKRILLSAALIGVAAVPAFAADLPVKAPMAAPIVAPVFNWSGFYIGVDGGGMWGRSQITHSAIVPAGAFAVDVAAVTAASSPDLRLNGWTFGAHIGYNWQFSQNWLIGLEADGGYFRLRSNVNGIFPFPSTLAGGALGPPTLTFTSATSFNTDWLFTFRPRVGITFGNALLYGTGGLAVTNETVTQTSGVLNAATFNSSLSETRLGWVAGGGVEYAFDRNWSIRAEYLHMDFGTASGTGNALVPTGVFANAVCTPGQTAVTGPATITGCSISSRLTADVIRGGITYRFGGPDAVVARY